MDKTDPSVGASQEMGFIDDLVRIYRGFCCGFWGF
jgi:hypothetical protein